MDGSITLSTSDTRVVNARTKGSTCSTTKMALNQQFRQLAEMCCSEVFMPDEIGCCGWAGDRGFTIPELISRL